MSWWKHEAKWWQFWWPQSGLPGGLIVAVLMWGVALLVFVK